MTSTTISGNWAESSNTDGYWALNNVWDIGSLVNGTNFTQAITYNPATFPNGTTLSWSYPNYNGAEGVWSFPEIIYGDATHAGVLADSSSGPTPTQISNLSLTANYSITLDSNPANYDVIFDTWLTSGPPTASGANIVKEVSFYAWEPGDNFTGWNLIFSANGDNYYSRPGSTQIAVVPANAEQLSGTVNFGQIFSELVSHGVVSGSDYLSGVELGAEPWKGSGSVTINSLSYEWSSNSSSSTTSSSTTSSSTATSSTTTPATTPESSNEAHNSHHSLFSQITASHSHIW
jgi:hypothetical protein